MIIVRTPHRISLTGGGSDIKDFYKKNIGAVLSFSIDKYQYHNINKNYEDNFLLNYIDVENIKNIEDIKHIGIKEVFKLFNIKNVQYNVISDIENNIGISSSSSFYVSMVNICNLYNNNILTKKDIAEIACNIEINILNKPIGKQDQYACSFGGINMFEFLPNENVNILNMNNIKYDKLQNNFLLFKIKRKSSSLILNDVINNINNNIKYENILKKMVDLTYTLKNDFLNNNFDNVGLILNDNWEYKKELSKYVSNDYINEIYNIAIKNGADGGKILGAGGGGCILFYVKNENIDKVRYSLKHLEEIKFNIEFDGTKIIYNSNEYN